MELNCTLHKDLHSNVSFLTRLSKNILFHKIRNNNRSDISIAILQDYAKVNLLHKGKHLLAKVR